MDINKLNGRIIHYHYKDTEIEFNVGCFEYNPRGNVNFSDFTLSLTTTCVDQIILESVKKIVSAILASPSSYKPNNELSSFLVDLLTDKDTVVNWDYAYKCTLPILAHWGGNTPTNSFALYLAAADRINGCETAYESVWEKYWQHTPFLKGDLNRVLQFYTGPDKKLIGLELNQLGELFYVLQETTAERSTFTARISNELKLKQIL